MWGQQLPLSLALLPGEVRSVQLSKNQARIKKRGIRSRRLYLPGGLCVCAYGLRTEGEEGASWEQTLAWGPVWCFGLCGPIASWASTAWVEIKQTGGEFAIVHLFQTIWLWCCSCRLRHRVAIAIVLPLVPIPFLVVLVFYLS